MTAEGGAAAHLTPVHELAMAKIHYPGVQGIVFLKNAIFPLENGFSPILDMNCVLQKHFEFVL